MDGRQRRPKGTGSLHLRRDGSWIAQVNLVPVDGKRKRKTYRGRTFCDVLRRLSATVPPIPDMPRVRPNRGDAMRAARAKGTHTAREWYALVRSTKNICAYCQQPGRMTKDHIVPITRGGSDAIDNLIPACLPCNMEKHQLTADEYRHWRTLLGKPHGSSVEDALAWFDAERVGA